MLCRRITATAHGNIALGIPGKTIAGLISELVLLGSPGGSPGGPDGGSEKDGEDGGSEPPEFSWTHPKLKGCGG